MAAARICETTMFDIDFSNQKNETFFPKYKNQFYRKCTVDLLKRRLPILKWMPQYTLKTAFQDFLAGFTVAMTAIPQSIAYGAVAGLPVEYGLYTAFAGPFVYALFGSVRQITVGPTVVMAIMTHEYTLKGGAPYAIVLSFLAGCFELIAGLLNLGWMMDFISGPVISGFCSAASVTVIVSQTKTMLGLTFSGSSFFRTLTGIFSNWRSINPWDSALSFACILFLLAMQNIMRLKKLCGKARCFRYSYVSNIVWFVSTCRNAMAVIFGCIIAYVFELYGFQPFRLTGEIKSGIPSFQLPPFSFALPANINTSFTNVTGPAEEVVFSTILMDLGTGLFMVPVIAILEQVAIAKAFSSGGKTDSTQEIITLGLGSIFSSFFGCMPLTASFSRSSVLSASGGKTQFASFFNGCVILIALSFLMPTFYYIPKAVLGAVIVVAVYSMIELGEILPMWRGRRIELIPFGTTFFCCLLINIEYGILIGAQMHLLLLAYESTHSAFTYNRFKKDKKEWILVKADRSLYFPSVERFRRAIAKFADVGEPSKCTTVIDLGRVYQVDYTSLRMLKAILAAWDKRGDKYSFVNVSLEVEKLLRSVLQDRVNVSNSDVIFIPDDKEDDDCPCEEASTLLPIITSNPDALLE